MEVELQSHLRSPRLKRARAIEASTFALGMHEHSIDNAGHVQVDDAFAQPEPGAKTPTISNC